MTGDTAPTEHTVPSPMPPATRVPRGERVLAGLLGTGCLAVMVLAAWLDPSPEGHGTHTQIGLNECTWVMLFDTPCMTCGMTTAYAHAADAEFGASFTTQPMGMVLSVATAATFWLTLLVAATGSTLGRSFARMLTSRVLIVLLLMGAAAWAYKILTWPTTPV